MQRPQLRGAQKLLLLNRTQPGPAPLRFCLLLLLFTATSVPALMAQSWYSAAWTSRQQITINSNALAYSLSSDLVKFPFLFSIGAANDVFTKAQASGNDILFTAADGVTKIPHEIESYNNSTPILTAWVQLPTFFHSSTTVIYMYYGNPNAGNQQQPTQVWDSSYGSVWHLKETGEPARTPTARATRTPGWAGRSQPTRRRQGQPGRRLPATARPSTRLIPISSRCRVRWDNHRM